MIPRAIVKKTLLQTEQFDNTSWPIDMTKLLGIEFAPLNVPLQRRLQTLAAGSWFVTMIFGFVPCLFLTLYLLVYTKFWWLVLLYFAWIYADRNTSEQGGRPISWVKNWTWWLYVRQYFPLQLSRVPGPPLDPKKNYLFCCFPHGVLPISAFNAFTSNSKEYNQLFPNHSPRGVTLGFNFHIPLFREFAFALGGISSSYGSLSYVLSKPEGGYIVALVPGGAAEAYESRPGVYKTLVGRRRGFVKLALKNGSPLVPVMSFGETDLFDQFDGPKLRRVQEFVRKYTGVAPVVPVGRGFFQYSFGLIPRRRAVTTLVGNPIEVSKVENPSSEQIEELHQKFVQELTNLFEEHKHKYLKDPQDKHLEIL